MTSEHRTPPRAAPVSRYEAPIGVPELLFVYGTLRQGSGNLMSERLASEAVFVGNATVRGSLYDTGRFPACCDDDDDAEARVYGEVWALRPEFVDGLMHTLDQYEGYAPDARHESLFVRVRDRVRYDDGSEQEAWVYRYNQPVDPTRRVASGDWMKR